MSASARDAVDAPSVSDPFAGALLEWFDAHGRKDLPWQHPRSPYRVWLSEVMLQQTQVRTAIPYFERFVAEIPSIGALAGASLDRVLALWSGLGYYRRARNLHRAARVCVEQYAGELPHDFATLSSLPGIGRSTAGAILAQAFGQRHAILDGNVRRVLSRWHGVQGWAGSAGVQRTLWRHAESHTPATRVADYTQAIMDLGATLCVRTRPRCALCPVASGCMALAEGTIALIPQSKPARAKPTRETTMLIVRDGAGRVLLERRPPTGVWAGLWSVPESLDIAAADAVLRDRYAIAPQSKRALGAFVHSFSHYHLRVTPLVIDAKIPDRVGDGERAWCARETLADFGLPAPVRTLIETVYEEERWRDPSTA